MTKQLTTQNATITTVAVEVKTLTITGKQVTLAVFRQLREEQLVADDGTLNGTPWGYVNYHPDKCAGNDHWHLVWQRDEELLRSRVEREPKWRALCPDDADRYLDASILAWATDPATTAEQCPLPSRNGNPGYPAFMEIRNWSHPNGVRFMDQPSEAAMKVAVGAAKIKEYRRRSQDDSVREYSRKDHARWAAQEEASDNYTSALRQLTDECAAYGRTLAELHSDCGALAEAEFERQQRHHLVRRQLADLPQLFIAV
ncbi:hypothetical protein AB0H18_33560 [Streptomyces sp. NPDC020766]|uniref:hypothetical protein n=1 Tax=Streptomyces sp. NPDC020766 TaxID=3155011 RepID=UPI0033CB12F4